MALGCDAARWWAEIESRQAEIAPGIEAVIEEWSAEVRGSGGGASSGHAFKTVRQGPLQQAEHMLGQLPRGSEARALKCHVAPQPVLGPAFR